MHHGGVLTPVIPGPTSRTLHRMVSPLPVVDARNFARAWSPVNSEHSERLPAECRLRTSEDHLSVLLRSQREQQQQQEQQEQREPLALEALG